MGDFEVLTVSNDRRLSSLIEDPEGVIRRVEGGGVPTIVDVEGVSMMDRSQKLKMS